MSTEAQQNELLLLASKAAGYNVEYMEGLGMVEHGPQLIGLRAWNPLEHEGDRFRLARDLRMTIEFDAHQVCVQLPNGCHAWVPWGPDLDATTDAQAIVLAAAKAGSLMS